jgi:hypothetical protein
LKADFAGLLNGRYLSRTKADQQDKEEHVQDFRNVEEIVEPVKRRRSPHGQQGSADELDTRHEISHQAGKRDFGLNERFVNSLRAAGDKTIVCPEMAKNSPSETRTSKA